MKLLSRRHLLGLLAIAAAAAALPANLLLKRRRSGTGRKEARFYRTLTVLLLAVLLPALGATSACSRSVQEPVVAGSFYPSDADTLRRMVRKYLEDAGKPRIRGEILGLIAPHAGYIYSGPIAGHAYRQVSGESYDLVVVIAPSHTAPFNGVSVLLRDAYRTPMGEVPLDRNLAAALTERTQWIQYVPALFAREHSLEVHLPFLQETLKPGFRVLPVVMGNPSSALARAFADVLSDAVRGRKVLFVASSDMSHYHPYDNAVTMDLKTLDLIGSGNPDELFSACTTRKSELCGLGPVQVMMHLARKMGIKSAKVLKYANSGDTAGDRARVVGYGSIAFVRDGPGLSLADKQSLLTLARRSLDQFVREGTLPSVFPGSEALKEPGASFVTLKIGDQLRGCIGQLEATMPLHRSVAEMTRSSCSRDMRFKPVQPEEVDRIRIEISVLTPFSPVTDPLDIRVGEDGLYLAAQGRTGVLLPQVPVEQGWDRNAFLDAICRKAGLPSGAWKEAGAKLYKFQADVFSE
ncbi:MAG: AmmeMemoRadiSam system protein B [bacterium]|nr:MAG: AmmeMemoRadiSam system protein B [bacterium]